MNLEPRTPGGIASLAALMLYHARKAPEMLNTPMFTDLFRENGARIQMEVARRIATHPDLASAVLAEPLRSVSDPLWIRAARAAKDRTPMLFPEYDDDDSQLDEIA